MRSIGWPGIAGSRPPTICARDQRTHVEKSTLKGTDGKLNAVTVTAAISHAPIVVPAVAPDLDGVMACSIDNPECEACQ